jgi:hypothetical protein
MADDDERYSGDFGRFVGLTIASFGGGKIDFETLPKLHASWELRYVALGGINIDVFEADYDAIEKLLCGAVGTPYFIKTGADDLKRSYFQRPADRVKTSR